MAAQQLDVDMCKVRVSALTRSVAPGGVWGCRLHLEDRISDLDVQIGQDLNYEGRSADGKRDRQVVDMQDHL